MTFTAYTPLPYRWSSLHSSLTAGASTDATCVQAAEALPTHFRPRALPRPRPRPLPEPPLPRPPPPAPLPAFPPVALKNRPSACRRRARTSGSSLSSSSCSSSLTAACHRQHVTQRLEQSQQRSHIGCQTVPGNKHVDNERSTLLAGLPMQICSTPYCCIA